MTLEQINDLKIEDCKELLILRFFNGEVPEEYIELTQEQLEAELTLYKAELIAEEEARLAEIARVEALEVRFAAINDLRLCMDRIGNNPPNMELFKKQIIDENNVALLEALENADDELIIELGEQERLDKRIAAYREIDELLLEAIAEQAEGRPEKLEAYLVLRNKIKVENPL